MLIVSIFLITIFAATAAEKSGLKDTKTDENLSTLSNGFVEIVFNDELNQIKSLSADFHGEGKYGSNLLTKPFQATYDFPEKISRKNATRNLHSSVVKNDATSTAYLTSKSMDNYFQEDWLISLEEKSRKVRIQMNGTLLQDITTSSHLSYTLYLNNPSMYALFDQGVMQMMNQADACLGSESHLPRAYFLGNGGALDILFNQSPAKGVVFHSTTNDVKYSWKSALELNVAGNSYPHVSQDVSQAWSPLCWSELATTKNSSSSQSSILPKGTTWTLDITLLPNNYDFPVYTIEVADHNLPFLDTRTYLTGIYASAVGCLQSYYSNQEGIIAPTISHPDVGYSPDTNFFDPDNYLTLSALLYAGDEYLTQQVKSVIKRTAETMCGVGKDVDVNYCQLSRQRMHSQGISYTSRRYQLKQQQQQRKQLKSSSQSSSNSSSATSLLFYASNSRSGQLMHHFINLSPTYSSIAGSEQLGPNIFWTLLTMKYLALTQDYDFLSHIFPFIDLSVKFLLSFIDTSIMLVHAPGPLFIDVLIRENYTMDSNAMMVEFLHEAVVFYRSLPVGIDQDDTKLFVQELQGLIKTLSQNINTYLWNTHDNNDHYVTQLNTDRSSTRDFIDYDANLIAITSGVASSYLGDKDNNVSYDRVQKILTRIDAGPHTHIRATWCSELAYSGNVSDCYIVGGNYCGDSIVTLARIGWYDARVRKLTGDVTTYQKLILAPLQADLVQYTWLYERYDENGSQIRTAYFFEYPALVTMLLREISYGIQIGLEVIEIDPIMLVDDVKSFQYHLGNVKVIYGPDHLEISLPGEKAIVQKYQITKICRIHHLSPSTAYQVHYLDEEEDRMKQIPVGIRQLRSNAQGLLSFEVEIYQGRTVIIDRMM